MADEIAQVCALEIEGVKMVIKGSVEVAQMLARMLRGIIKFSKEHKEEKADSKLKKAGNKKVDQIMKISEGPAAALQIPEQDFAEVIRIATDKGLHYADLIDFNPYDKLTPILLPAQEGVIWGKIMQSVRAKNEAIEKDLIASYGKQIAEEKEKLLDESLTPKEKEEIQIKLENLTQAKTEAEELAKSQNDIVNKEDPAISLLDYLRQAKDTEFEKNPEKAVAELEQGVELGKKLSVKECFQPIRAKNLIPDTKFFFYYPDTGSVVARQFHVDEETGLVYSNYALKTYTGEKFQCSDRGMTKDAWNEKIMPELMDNAGMIEGTQCRMFDTQEKLEAYVKKHDNVKSQAEIDIEKKVKAGEPVFHSAEAEREILNAVEEKHKGIASAKVDESIVTISMDPNSMYRRNGKIVIRLEDGQSLLIGSLRNERIENGKATFDIKKDDPVILVEKDAKLINQFHQITGAESLDIINKSKEMPGMDIAKRQDSHR